MEKFKNLKNGDKTKLEKWVNGIMREWKMENAKLEKVEWENRKMDNWKWQSGIMKKIFKKMEKLKKKILNEKYKKMLKRKN